MKQPKTFYDKYKAVQAIGTDTEIPYNVWTVVTGAQGVLSISGPDVLLHPKGDYTSLERARTAIEWYVTQLGGAVKWS